MLKSSDGQQAEKVMEIKERILILYATQTGNAMDAAERISREAERRGCPASVISVDQFDPSSLSKERIVVFVVSTAGQGDAPDMMKVDQLVFEELMRERCPKLVNHLDYLGVQVAGMNGPLFLSIFMNIIPWESDRVLY